MLSGFSCCFHVSGSGNVAFGVLVFYYWHANYPLELLLKIQASSPVALGVRIPTVAVHMTELFDTAAEQLYSIFTVKDVSYFSG